MHCRMFSSIPGLCSLDTGCITNSPSRNNQATTPKFGNSHIVVDQKDRCFGLMMMMMMINNIFFFFYYVRGPVLPHHVYSHPIFTTVLSLVVTPLYRRVN